MVTERRRAKAVLTPLHTTLISLSYRSHTALIPPSSDRIASASVPQPSLPWSRRERPLPPPPSERPQTSTDTTRSR
eukprot:366333-Chlamydomonas_euryale.AAC.5